MTRRALGRGLSALLADSLAQGDELLEVDIDLIEPNPDQPRLHFNESKLEELAQSIRSNGLVQPILLRRVSNGRYQIVAGERRWRAAQKAGLHKVNAVIRSIPDAKLLELALIENIQRQELNPIEEAQAYQRLIQNLGLTQDEVAKRVGKDRSSIANYLRLLKLPAKIQQMLEEDLLTMGHARAILGLESEEDQLRLAEDIVSRKLSVRETEQAVKRATSNSSNRQSSTPNENDANIRAAELKMKRFLGTQVKIHLNQNGGMIEIDFSSMSELDRIYSVIMRK
ncbi:MAG: ParB/RepB/Spo0J family partition protein [Blastocatellales bacterium]